MNNQAITYDYKSIKMKREMETMVCDAYENLGWELTSTVSSENSLFDVVLSFKRDRKIQNKVQLLKLQQKVDKSLLDIQTFQSRRKAAGTATGISIGVLAAAAFSGGISLSVCVEGVGALVGGIVLAVAGAGIGVLAWFLSRKVKKIQSEKLTNFIESEMDNLADLCESANNLRKGM